MREYQDMTEPDLKINDYIQVRNKDLFGIYCGLYQGQARIFLDEPIIKKGKAKYILLVDLKELKKASKYEN